jgi:endoglucanase
LKFDFVPDKDLSRLKSEGHALDFMVRGNEPGIKFDIRFKDTKTADPADHPWRMRTIIDNSDASWDRRWHHVRILLTAFTEHGAWDNNTWYEPQGKFDWTKIDDLEISAEYVLNSSAQIWFDNIHISNLDTAIIRVTEELGIEDHKAYGNLEITIAPNPVHDYAEITFSLDNERLVRIDIWSVSGIKVRTILNREQYPGPQLFTWDGRNDSGLKVPAGIYICKVFSPGFTGTARIVKY